MTSKTRFGVISLTVLLTVCLAASPALGDKKPKAYKAQTTHSFVNNEAEPAFGLKVELSSAGEVKTESQSGKAGPFRDIRGNGTGSVELTNAESPIEPGNETFDLVFGTYSKKIKVKSWWWTNAKGKRIGEKKKD